MSETHKGDWHRLGDGPAFRNNYDAIFRKTKAMIQDYELETLREIEKAGSRLNGLSQSHVCDLYREWSSITANAGWLVPSAHGISSFVEWATTPPCDVSTNPTN